MDSAVNERRRDTRFSQPLVAHIQVTLRPGNTVALVNLGVGGAYVHSPRPIRPGARIHVQLASTTGTRRFHAHVLRCGIASLDGVSGASYGAALRFESRCDLPWEAATPHG